MSQCASAGCGDGVAGDCFERMNGRPFFLGSDGDLVAERIARGRSLPARLVERARILLRAAAGLQDQQIASEFGITPEKAARWRNLYLDGGIEAQEKDASRPMSRPELLVFPRHELQRFSKSGRTSCWKVGTYARADAKAKPKLSMNAILIPILSLPALRLSPQPGLIE